MVNKSVSSSGDVEQNETLEEILCIFLSFFFPQVKLKNDNTCWTTRFATDGNIRCRTCRKIPSESEVCPDLDSASSN